MTPGGKGLGDEIDRVRAETEKLLLGRRRAVTMLDPMLPEPPITMTFLIAAFGGFIVLFFDSSCRGFGCVFQWY